MARYHYWQFLVNQEGQPIRNAEISLYRAGTDVPVFVYESEFGSDGTSTPPQAYTNKAGYFEFWIGDDQESEGLPIGEKFKIQWEKENIASGSIDWIDIFPGFEAVNENDPDSGIKNKLVSNALAYGWEQHIQHQSVTQTSIPTFEQIIVTNDPVNDNHVVTREYVDSLAQGMVWQNPVISFTDPTSGTPAAPSDGDRYIATQSASAVGWTEDYIYEWDVSIEEWIEIEPIQGYSLLNENDDRHYHYNGTEWIKFSAGFAWYLVSSNTNVSNRNGYLVDCSSTPITLTFPADPDLGYRIDILDFTANSETNNIILDGNGNLIEGQSDFTIDISGAGLQMVYTTDTYGWKVINEVYA